MEGKLSKQQLQLWRQITRPQVGSRVWQIEPTVGDYNVPLIKDTLESPVVIIFTRDKDRLLTYHHLSIQKHPWGRQDGSVSRGACH